MKKTMFDFCMYFDFLNDNINFKFLILLELVHQQFSGYIPLATYVTLLI